jgi:hypothetical protein
MNEERLKRKIEKAAAAVAAMKITTAKGGKGKKGKGDEKGKGDREVPNAVTVDVTSQEDDPSLLEPLPLPR